jgi:hypothetical protein
MNIPVSLLGAAIIFIAPLLAASVPRSREFLTEGEIALIQARQEIGPRVKFYLEAAQLRLKSAEDRLRGEETEPGDPLEYFTPEDMLDGYYRILESVMMNLEEAHQTGGRDRSGIQEALKALKKRTEEYDRRLDSLKNLAEKKKNEELLRLIQKAEDITRGAHEGSKQALEEKIYDPEKK